MMSSYPSYLVRACVRELRDTGSEILNLFIPCIFNVLFHENNQMRTTENGAITPKHVASLIN